MSDKLRIAVIIGSVREGRFGPVVARWFLEQIREHADLEVDAIDLAEVGLPMAFPAFGTKPTGETAAVADAVRERLAAADAFVVITPEYNHSYPASLKNLIDWHNVEWHAKPVAFVSYGGLSGGMRSVEHLRPVFAEVHATTIRDAVSLHNVWSLFDEDGAPTDPEGSNGAAKLMIERLKWWAEALQEARVKSPYTV
ncbi:NAD(P)H-dependent oxidoreductase [Kitasatospora sp. GAS204B]|uniref:NADPH-dependent FMN reductase n=1 Tax=unclassified Kitasatospora TaxID=2633591 RepID=UPI0024740E3F|nr:NAD(P)H-dependent oxidoreductase [Kitasatospora sp. GAS204B]MDH6117016.1 NAD(P)H-dependent FMN reductase [Kitasatospora sp. GAS204B]